jgi:hypothetical protein
MPEAVKGAIRAKVSYAGPSANISVTLDGPVKDEKKTNANGEVVFEKLTPGPYKLEASGVVKNSRRKGKAEATVPTPPSKQPIEVNVKLE